MRSNKSYIALCDSPAEPKLEQEALERQVKEYLAKGGEVKQIPTGMSAYRPLSTIRTEKKKP
jgi:hypothetical protein